MKWSIAVLIILISCQPKAVDESKTVERGGLRYLINSETPFTGTTIGKHPNGQRDGEMPYKDGLRHGVAKAFYDNGQLELLAQMENDIKVDTIYMFFRSGQIKGRGQFLEGKPNGLWISWDEEGSSDTIVYNRGEIVD